MNGGKVSSRELRRQLSRQASAFDEDVIQTLQALVNNDRVTQKLLADLTAASQARWESTCLAIKGTQMAIDAFQERGFWGRLNWLVTGR